MTKLIDNRDLCGKFPQFNFLWLFLSFSQMNVETPTYKALSGITVKPKGFLWPYYDCRHNNHSNLNCISNEPNYTHIPCPSSLLCFTLSHTVAYFRCLVLFFLCVLWFCTCTFILIHVLVLVYCSLSEGSPHICVFLTMLMSLHGLSISSHVTF